MFAYCLNNPIDRYDVGGKKSIEVDGNEEGASVSFSDDFTTAIGTVYVKVELEFTAVEIPEIYIGQYQIKISTTDVALVLPEGQSFSVNYDSGGISPGTFKTSLTPDGDYAWDMIVSSKGWGMKYSEENEDISISITIQYMPNFLTMAIEKVAARISPLLKGAVGGSGWSTSRRYAGLIYASAGGHDKLGGTAYMFR